MERMWVMGKKSCVSKTTVRKEHQCGKNHEGKDIIRRLQYSELPTFENRPSNARIFISFARLFMI